MAWISLASPVFWLGLGGILVLAELAVPGVYLLWVGLAALATGLAGWFLPGLGWHGLSLVFALLSVGFCLWANRIQARHAHDTDINRRGAAMVGRVGVLEQAIENGVGRMRLGDTVWRVRGPNLPAGVRVEVVSADGATLIVEKAL